MRRRSFLKSLAAGGPTTVAEFDRDANLANQLGANQVLLWEADYIDDRANKAELQTAMRARDLNLSSLKTEN